jgi:hypothetical protein
MRRRDREGDSRRDHEQDRQAETPESLHFDASLSPETGFPDRSSADGRHL